MLVVIGVKPDSHQMVPRRACMPAVTSGYSEYTRRGASSHEICRLPDQ